MAMAVRAPRRRLNAPERRGAGTGTAADYPVADPTSRMPSICRTSRESSLASLPWARRETPTLSSRRLEGRLAPVPGYVIRHSTPCSDVACRNQSTTSGW